MIMAAAIRVEMRRLGKTGFEVSTIGMGCWQIGGSWTLADDVDTHKDALHAYLDAGGNLLDTANVYGGDYGSDTFGWSEKTIGEVLAERKAAGKADGRIIVATKAGRAPTTAAPGAHGPARYTYEALSESLAGSAARLGVTCVDLLQLHCPPPEVLVDKSPTYDALRRLVSEGRILHWGVSVETVDEAMLAIAQPDCATIQIIFNMLRLKPARVFLPAAKAADVGTLIRLPLASGLLTGKVDAAYLSALDDRDHRKFNVAGASFDKGETWSGLGEHLHDIALPAVGQLQEVAASALTRGELPPGATFGQAALRWIIDHEGVACVIPGARTVDQARNNLSAGALPPLSAQVHAEVEAIYEARVKQVVEAERW
jgi:aryl-alcohol dehydrogenase-like predicted oxidoreductase